jgi:CHAT domain-containing protein
MGELSRVPWHAARDAAGDYAVQRAVVTYAVSARSLCEAADGAPPLLDGTGVVLADPDTAGAATDLAAARSEAAAIHAAFYPRARHLGRHPDGSPAADGRGTGDELRRWLADDASGTGAVLHAACHGVSATGVGPTDTSYLLLAEGQRLAAEDLVRALAARPGRRVALAVLAACSSGVSGRGYDEAFSLATALLAGGTRTVVSAMWRVPDSATSVLMYLFHHFVRERPPREALRAAQLWMLCPDQREPVELPDAVRAELADGDTTDPVAWAGFAHAGR